MILVGTILGVEMDWKSEWSDAKEEVRDFIKSAAIVLGAVISWKGSQVIAGVFLFVVFIAIPVMDWWVTISQCQNLKTGINC